MTTPRIEPGALSLVLRQHRRLLETAGPINGRASRRLTTQDFADDVPESVIWDDVAWDTAPAARLVAGTTRFTSDRIGTFRFDARVVFVVPSTAPEGDAFVIGRSMAAYLVLNGARYIGIGVATVTILQFPMVACTSLVRLAPGDYVEVLVMQSSDRTLTLLTDPTGYGYTCLEYLQVA